MKLWFKRNPIKVPNIHSLAEAFVANNFDFVYVLTIRMLFSGGSKAMATLAKRRETNALFIFNIEVVVIKNFTP